MSNSRRRSGAGRKAVAPTRRTNGAAGRTAKHKGASKTPDKTSAAPVERRHGTAASASRRVTPKKPPERTATPRQRRMRALTWVLVVLVLLSTVLAVVLPTLTAGAQTLGSPPPGSSDGASSPAASSLVQYQQLRASRDMAANRLDAFERRRAALARLFDDERIELVWTEQHTLLQVDLTSWNTSIAGALAEVSVGAELLDASSPYAGYAGSGMDVEGHGTAPEGPDVVVSALPSFGVPVLSAAGIVCPVPGARFSDDWGAARTYGGPHAGNDLFAPVGNPIVAPGDGIVRRVDTTDDYVDGTGIDIGGRSVSIWTTDGEFWFFGHMDTVADLTPGQPVTAGQLLGTVGTSGNARYTPPHSHVEHHINSRAENPYPLLVEACKAS